MNQIGAPTDDEEAKFKEFSEKVDKEIGDRPVRVNKNSPNHVEFFKSFEQSVQKRYREPHQCKGYCKIFRARNLSNTRPHEIGVHIMWILSLGTMERSETGTARAIIEIPGSLSPTITQGSIVVCCKRLLNLIRSYRGEQAHRNLLVNALDLRLEEYKVGCNRELSQVLRRDWSPENDTMKHG